MRCVAAVKSDKRLVNYMDEECCRPNGQIQIGTKPIYSCSTVTLFIKVVALICFVLIIKKAFLLLLYMVIVDHGCGSKSGTTPIAVNEQSSLLHSDRQPRSKSSQIDQRRQHSSVHERAPAAAESIRRTARTNEQLEFPCV